MSPYWYFSMSDQVIWRLPWWWKYRHPRRYRRYFNAFKGYPTLSDLLEESE